MEVSDISATDLESLKGQGYTEADLSMLAESEIKALLTPASGGDGGGIDPHDAAAADQERAAAEAAAAAAAAAASGEKDAVNVDTPAGATATAGFVVPTYNVEVPADAEEQIAALKAKEREAFKGLMDGTKSEDEYLKIKDESEAGIDRLKDAIRSAAILQTLNTQNEEQRAAAEWEAAQRTAFSQFKAEGLDYKDPARPGLLAAFNHHLKALAALPANEKRDGAWFLAEAHKLTKADLGITTTARPNVPGKVSGGVDPAEIPPTLRAAPVAATGAINGDEFAQLRILMEKDPLAYERAHAALTDAQRERWMAAE